MAPPASDQSPLYAVLLAAGASQRFGEENKLLTEIEGTALVRRVAQRLAASRVAGIVAVTGFEADRIREALTGLDVEFAENHEFADGLASSIKCGVAALPRDAAGVMIVLGDMPGVSQAHLDGLITVFEEDREKIVYPEREDGTQGNPVIWPARYFTELQQLTGDAGAKQLISLHEKAARPVPISSDEALGDIDTPGDLEVWLKT